MYFWSTFCFAIDMPFAMVSGVGLGVPEKKFFGLGISTVAVASKVSSNYILQMF